MLGSPGTSLGRGMRSTSRSDQPSLRLLLCVSLAQHFQRARETGISFFIKSAGESQFGRRGLGRGGQRHPAIDGANFAVWRFFYLYLKCVVIADPRSAIVFSAVYGV